MTPPDHSAAVAVAAAHDLNEELTILVNGFEKLMLEFPDASDPAYKQLVELACSATRCGILAGHVLAYGKARGLKPEYGTLPQTIGAIGLPLQE